MSATPNARGQKYAAVANPEDCTGCQCCAVMCPEAIVTVDRQAGNIPAESGAGDATKPAAARGNSRRTGEAAGGAAGKPAAGPRAAEGP